MLLLLIAVTVLVTIVLSNDSLQASRSNILNKGNLADFTVSIPANVVTKSINEANSKDNSSKTYLPGTSPADIQLQNELSKLGLQYSISKTVNLSDMLTRKSFILSNNEQPSSINPTVVNNLVLQNGSSEIPTMVYTNANMPVMMSGFKYFESIQISNPNVSGYQKNIFNYKVYMEQQPWNFAKAILNAVWNLDTASTEKFIKTIAPLAEVPKNETVFNENYNLWQVDAAGNPTNKFNTNSYWYKWRSLMGINGFTYNGYGFTLDLKENIPLLGDNAQLPFTADVYDPTSYFAIASSNFMRANAGTKDFIPKETLEQALKLPFKTYLNVDSSTNPTTAHTVYNPVTKTEQVYPDFLTWLSELPDKYKIKVNSLNYVLIGAGMAPNIMYPVLNANQLLVNSTDSGVLFVNNAGFARATFGTSNKPELYYSVRYPPDFNGKYGLFETRHKLFEAVQQFTIKNYGENTAFLINDPKQPNYVIYLRANFLDNLKNIILIITLVIALIIALLSLFFISTLLRSIIKQSKVTFGVGLANGISKAELATSFFPFALVPAIFCGALGYLIGYFLMKPMNSVYLNYWTVSIPHLDMQWWLFFIIPLIVFVILYVLILLVIFWTLRKNTQEILNSSSEFRMNALIIYTKKLTSKLSALSSFRWTFMMGNITRFIVLTGIVFAFISLSTITVGSLYEFQNSLSYTNRNRQYTFAFNLYSPTINDGYYSAMPFTQLGIAQEGMYNNYTTFSSTDGNYDAPNAPGNTFNYSGQAYANALAYPYAKNKYFTSLFLPSNKVATELDHNIQFFNNKVFTKLDLDVTLDVAGAMINPWNVAQQIAPQSVISLADTYLQNQVQQNYDFYYWLQQQNDLALSGGHSEKIPGVNSPFNGQKIYYSTYLPGVNSQPFTLNGSPITADFNNAPNQSEWIFIRQKNPLTEKEEWIINQKHAILEAPSYQATPKATRLFVEMLTNVNNPLFQYWYKYVNPNNPLRGKADQPIRNYSYLMVQGAVPLEPNDETYTYIKATVDKKNGVKIQPFAATINGIKPDSDFLTLYNSKNQDLKYLLNSTLPEENGKPVYPLIVNEVVERKYKLYVGSEIQILPNNTYDRFNLENIGEPAYAGAETTFKVVGITDSKSEEQFYTSQSIANKVLGYQNFSTDATPVQWRGPKHPGRGYVPFNGIFTKQEIPEFAMNFGGVYAPSGMSTAKGAWNTNIGTKPGQVNGGEQAYLVWNNLKEMNTITSINEMVDRQDGNKLVPIPANKQNPFYVDNAESNALYKAMSPDLIGNAVRHIVKVFGNTSPIVTQLQSVDTPLISNTIGPTIDNTLANIEKVITACLIPTLIIIIALLASMIVVEAKRLISLMKVLGYSDLKNTFSFLFVYLIVLFLGTALAIPFTYGMLAAVTAIAFSAFNIIIAPVAPVWIYFAAFGAVASIFVGLFIYVWNQLKKINLSQEISVR
ncbi:hypothetical protein UREOM_6160 [Ureaplasma sp. OM1]|uniref:ABC3 transporter permease C-terminal domain-containing protein n=2 Tax=Ureaplasma ceti TaxID=3119530 RepID=A0ABP9U8B8_9BACT